MSAEPAKQTEVLWWARLAALADACARRLRMAALQCPAAAGLSEVEWLVLLACAGAGDGISQVELCDALGVSPAQTSTLVERMRRAELLAGRRSPLDRRRQLWTLTARGAERLNQILVELNQELAPLRAIFSRDEQRRLEDCLTRIVTGSAAPQLRLHTASESIEGCDDNAREDSP